jgi:hypothetical protein
MAEIKFGLREGPGKGKMHPTGGALYLHRRGGGFITFTAGNATLCASGATDQVSGWACAPKHADGKDAWKSNDSAEVDKVFIIDAIPGNLFEIPFDGRDASIAASLIGAGARICYNDESATYGKIQKVCYESTADSAQFLIHDIDTINKTALVSVLPTKYGIIAVT